MDTLAGIEAFVRSAQGGSYSAAARAMGVTPSAVSKAVSKLEARMGVRLFARTSRSMRLTDEGQTFFASCQRILADLEDAEAAAAQARGEASGRIHLDLPLAIGRLHILPKLPAFRARYPKVALFVTLTDRVVDLVEERVDVAVRVGHLPDSRLVARRFAEQHMAICAAPAYLEWRGAPQRLEDLPAHNCLAFVRPQSGRIVPWFLRSEDGETEFEPRGDFQSNNGEALRDAAVTGIGLVQLPRYLVYQELRDGALHEVLHGASRQAEPIWIVTRSVGQALPKVRAMSNFLADLASVAREWR
jgi:DNA-binding transcriptional LysR family regulator